MKTLLVILLYFFSFSVFAGLAGGGTNTEASQDAQPYDTFHEKRLLADEQQKQEDFKQRLAEIEANSGSLRGEIGSKVADVKFAHDAVDALRSQILAGKKLIPRDPWREIYGENKYVMAAGSGFVKFTGQIQETASGGIRVLGQIGNSTEAEYFVANFPYPFKAGESVDPTKIYVALEDGKFSYVTEDGFAKTLPKLNYGKPCAGPQNAAALEREAQNLFPQEESQVNAAEQMAKDKDEALTGIKKRLQDALDEMITVQNEASNELSNVKQQALKYDREYADKGDIFALRRMSERYQTGDGVGGDLKKSAEYSKKAEDRFQAEAARIEKANRLNEQESLKKKFLLNLDLADKHDNVQSALYVEKCYRCGLGIEKDLLKAQEYHDKATSLGIPRPPNTGP